MLWKGQKQSENVEDRRGMTVEAVSESAESVLW